MSVVVDRLPASNWGTELKCLDSNPGSVANCVRRHVGFACLESGLGRSVQAVTFGIVSFSVDCRRPDVIPDGTLILRLQCWSPRRRGVSGEPDVYRTCRSFQGSRRCLVWSRCV